MSQTTATPIIAPSTTLGDLAAIMADLSRAYPEAGHRVPHGAYLALMGHAEPSGPGAWWITSERDATTQYFVLEAYGTCTCQDHQRHGHLSPCKHRLAVEVLHRLERAETDREQLADAPIALELTDAAYAALDQLGEPCAIERQPVVGTCTRTGPRSAAARAAYRELYGEDPDPAA